MLQRQRSLCIRNKDWASTARLTGKNRPQVNVGVGGALY